MTGNSSSHEGGPPNAEGRVLASDIAFVSVAFLGGFSFWPALIALGTLFGTLGEEFGWSKAQVTSAQLIFTAVSIGAAPIIGPLIDRTGARPVLLVGLSLAPLPLILIGFSNGSFSLWIVVWIAASLAGQFIAPPIWSAGIARRFDRRRGLALGLAACGFATASAVVPLFIVGVIGLAAWRQFYFLMASFLLFVLLPLTYLFFRETEIPADEALSEILTKAGSRTFRKDILANRLFLQLLAIVLLVSFVVGGMLIHLQPMFIESGLTPGSAAKAFAFYGIGGIFGRIAGGWMLDHFHAGPAPALPMCVFPVFAVLLLGISSGPEIYLSSLAALLIGIAAGVEVDVVPFLVRRYFPPQLFGRTYIALAAVFVGGAGASPFLISLSFDGTGSYRAFLTASVVMGVLATIILIGLGRYPEKYGNSGE